MNDIAFTRSWTGMVAVEDTALAVTDSGGPGIPVVYVNGQFATQPYWRRVIAELGAGWRHITYDERARGKSKRFGTRDEFSAGAPRKDASRETSSRARGEGR